MREIVKIFLILLCTMIMSSTEAPKYDSGKVNTISIGDKVNEPNAHFDLSSGHGLLKSIRVKAVLPLEPNASAIPGEIPFGGGFQPVVDHLYSTKQSYEIKEELAIVEAWTKQHFIVG